MERRRQALPRMLSLALFAGALGLLGAVAVIWAQDSGVNSAKSGKLTQSAQSPASAIAHVKDHALRSGLFEARKAKHPSASAVKRLLGLSGTPVVGRASMVINDSGTVLYTKTFLGTGNTCEVDLGGPLDWQASTAYAKGDMVRASGTNFMANNAGTSGGSAPAFNTTFGMTTSDGTITWVCTGTDWTSGRAYTLGMVVRPVSQQFGFNFQVVTAGTSGGSEPHWPITVGATVTDNTVTWKAIGFFPGSFTGCQPMQLVSKASGGAETAIAKEGDAVGSSQLSGWAEFYAMNASGKAAFRAAVAGLMTDEDESGSGIFTAGPGAGALTKIATSTTTIGGRHICGFSTMVGMNNPGQVVYDGYTWFNGLTWQANHSYASGVDVIPTVPNGLAFAAQAAGTSGSSEPAWPTHINDTVTDGTITWKAFAFSDFDCDQDNHGLIRFTTGPGNELLVAQGSSVGGSTVIGFGADDDSTATRSSHCNACAYQNIDGFINSSGHVPVVLNLADGTQGVFNFTGPGTSTQVARTGGANPYTSISPRLSINNSDQVVFKATAGVDKIFRFTPPSTTVAVAAVGDDIGTRSGGSPSGVTIEVLGNFTDINSGGNVVFEADLSDDTSGFFFWDSTTTHLSQVTSAATGTLSPLAPDMITLNDSNVVAYVTGSSQEGSGGGDVPDEYESSETGGVFFWTKTGGSVKAIAVGDIIGGNTVSTVYAQHRSFPGRQLNSAGCVATAYHVNGDDAGFDDTEGEGGGHDGQLFVSCVQAAPTPTRTPTLTRTPTPTFPGGITATPTAVANAAGIPTLHEGPLAALALLLVAIGALVLLRSRS